MTNCLKACLCCHVKQFLASKGSKTLLMVCLGPTLFLWYVSVLLLKSALKFNHSSADPKQTVPKKKRARLQRVQLHGQMPHLPAMIPSNIRVLRSSCYSKKSPAGSAPLIKKLALLCLLRMYSQDIVSAHVKLKGFPLLVQTEQLLQEQPEEAQSV